MKIIADRKPNWLVAIGIPSLIFLSCIFITLTSKFKNNTDLLSNAILADLLLIAPLTYYLAIRKSEVPRLSISKVFIVGLLIAGIILNTHSNIFLHLIKIWISPVIELFVIYFIGSRFYFAAKRAKELNKNKPDFLLHCRIVMQDVTGNEKFGNIISSEIATWYYALLGRKDKTIDFITKFSNYRENGITIVLWAILSIFIIETTGMHFFISIWSKPTAWVFTALGFYACVQLYAHIKAVKARPILINSDSLEIHNGLAGDAFIHFDNIEKYELSRKIPTNRESIKISLLTKLENHNVVVYLKNPIQVTKIFGIKKMTDTVLFFVDKSKDFSVALNAGLAHNS